MTIVPEIYRVESEHVEAFVADDGQTDVAYCYGGTRSVPPNTPDEHVIDLLVRLRDQESQVKNNLINRALAEPIFGNTELAKLPPGFLGSRVGGARAILRAKTAENFACITDPESPVYEATVDSLFQKLGALLNKLGGRIKLTPDFGRFSFVSDLLGRYTPHVLGLACDAGGSGGKTTYTTTGIIAVQEEVMKDFSRTRLTLIGADGALGRDLARHYHIVAPSADVALCDLTYDSGLSCPRMERSSFQPSLGSLAIPASLAVG
jgi:hypothetical protein